MLQPFWYSELRYNHSVILNYATQQNDYTYNYITALNVVKNKYFYFPSNLSVILGQVWAEIPHEDTNQWP